jgi:hypothetical protein
MKRFSVQPLCGRAPKRPTCRATARGTNRLLAPLIRCAAAPSCGEQLLGRVARGSVSPRKMACRPRRSEIGNLALARSIAMARDHGSVS